MEPLCFLLCLDRHGGGGIQYMPGRYPCDLLSPLLQAFVPLVYEALADHFFIFFHSTYLFLMYN